MAASFIYIVWHYAKNLRECPRELFLLFFTKLTEYSCYGAINLAFVLFLSADAGLGDIAAGTYIGFWSIFLTLSTMLVGSVCDALGIKKTLLYGTIILLVSRFFLPLTTNIYIVSILGFIPMAIGMALMTPVLSVGIKIFTTKETAALGFGLFYTMMNVGWAIGAWIFDTIRGHFGEHVMINVPILGMELSTYQIIFMTGFIFTFPDLFAILFMREGVEMTDDKGIVITPRKKEKGHLLERTMKTVKKGAKDTAVIFKGVISEKPFWIFIAMLTVLVFVKLTFYHFHYTFPKYGVRVLGEGLKIGSIFGVLNPVMIVFLTPLFATLTRKIDSYKVMLVGTFISAGAVFIAAVPAGTFEPLMGTWFGQLVFERWLDIPADLQTPIFLALVIMTAVFTVGEAIWSPRLMQFTAEIAPKGKEGSYVALSYLPYFASKMIVGPMSGWLVATYTPEGASSYPMHHYVWYWIGGTAILSPIGLVIFKKIFLNSIKGHHVEDKNSELRPGDEEEILG